MSEAWKYFKIGLFGGIGFLAAYGVARILVAVVNTVLGHGPELRF